MEMMIHYTVLYQFIKVKKKKKKLIRSLYESEKLNLEDVLDYTAQHFFK